MKAVIGLGNPGEEYRLTRHNIGFQVVDEIARQVGARLKRKHASLVAEASLGGQKVLLAKPQTFMNGSGEAVVKLSETFSLDPSDFIVVHDDLDLDFGRLRIRFGGGTGGHRGIGSVRAGLSGGDFYRVRIGIGRPGRGEDPTRFVLSAFNRLEEDLIPEILQRSAAAVECLIRKGLDAARNAFNKRKLEA